MSAIALSRSNIFQKSPVTTALRTVFVDPVLAVLYFSPSNLLRWFGIGQKVVKDDIEDEDVSADAKTRRLRVASKRAEEEDEPDICTHCKMCHYTMENHLCQSMSVPELKQLLDAGNVRYVEGDLQPHCHNKSYRQKLTAGQQPAVAFVSCADSRCNPNQVVDALEGEVFVCRVAGNYVDTSVAGSMQFACQHLGTKMVIICGHTKCGAIKAASEFDDPGQNDKELPLVTLVRKIRNGLDDEAYFGRYACSDDSDKKLRRFQKQAGDCLVTANVVEQMGIMKHVLEGIPNVAVVGAVFCICTGRMEFLDQYVQNGINMSFSTGMPV
eukprot:TRINITY_DN348_c0_g2_i11.p1 TRINITY_DN348_c0_g2~~TRINITY_DN348_c0_g2_i11.p1  ORF type:complete len:378 (-),score=61.53 TRINITY_DN348_c0_g2_i11:512-1489(-)